LQRYFVTVLLKNTNKAGYCNPEFLQGFLASEECERGKGKKRSVLTYAIISNPLFSVRVVPSGFITTTVQVPIAPFGIENQAVNCVALSHRTFLALINLIDPELFVSCALILPDWKPEPVIVITTSIPVVEVGEILEMPVESDGGVVVEVSNGA